MLSINRISFALFAGAYALAGAVQTADAHHRRGHHHHASKPSNPLCRARAEGRATGQGLFGQGTENARYAAISDWQTKVGTRYGERYSDFSKARGVHWDCAKGAILKAKCVVVATPCR